MLAETGIAWDFADTTGNSGNTTTGSVVKRILFNPSSRKIFTSKVPPKFKAAISKYGTLLSVILQVMASKNKIDIQANKDVCTELCLHLLDFPVEREPKRMDFNPKNSSQSTWTLMGNDKKK